MRVTAWKGGTYGIRVGNDNARRHFPKHWDAINVEIDGTSHEFTLSKRTFWTTCPEFRGVVIKEWLERKGLLPWMPGQPPEFELEHLGGNSFRLQE